MFLYSSWLTDKIANNVPLDQMVRELLSATGGTFKSPATNFYQIERDTLKTAENVAQVFMGFRTQCAQCHNHPFDRWTMNDYYSFAAFFSQIGRKPSEDYREIIVFNSGGGDVRHPVSDQVMPPKFLGGADARRAGQGPPRRAGRMAHLAGQSVSLPRMSPTASGPTSSARASSSRWTISASAIRPAIRSCSRRWARSWSNTSTTSNSLVRDICNSHAYQRSLVRNPSNETDERNFAHANVRRIPAEMLLDCINQVTETKEKFQGLPLGARAVQIADGQTSNYFLTTFGRAKRETVCACEANSDPSLSQALHMLNGDAVHGKVAQGGVVKKLLDQGKTPEQVIENLYVRCLSRKPTPEEQQKLLAVVAGAENPQAGLDDVFWAILNSREFLFNH